MPTALKTRLSSSPLTPEELRDLKRANTYVMDIEVEGGTRGWAGPLPPEVQAVSDLRRELKPAEARIVLAFFYRYAPGNFG